MLLTRLRLENFRNYAQLDVAFQHGVHVLYGANGAGKTSVLEAIYYLALLRSFRTSQDKNLVQKGKEMFRIEGIFETPQGSHFKTHIAYSLREGKVLSLNGERVTRFIDYIGTIPVVLIAPSDLTISQSGPQMRRRFIDIMLSQSNKLYLNNLKEYKRALKHRNLLLQQEHPDETQLASWEALLSRYGAEIIRKRVETVALLSEWVQTLYQELSAGTDKVKLVYRSGVKNLSDNVEAQLAQLLWANRAKDGALGSTTVGPHRDDILFLLNGLPFRQVGSQGEHKTLIIALKLAEFRYLQQMHQQPPILLFDDIFGELDATRIQAMLGRLTEIGQVFVTTTSKNFFEKMHEIPASFHYYNVKNGTISTEVA